MSKKWWALVCALFLAGCVAMSVPRGTENVPPVLQGDVFVTRDGLKLPLRHWDAQGQPGAAPKAVIIGLHGMNDYSNAFDGPGRLWAREGITTLAYDQRGFGQGPDPGLWAGSDVLREDFDDFVAATRARYPGVPVFALGESMGGAVLLTALAQPDPAKLDGAILVAPAVWSRDDMPVTYRVALFLVAHLLPGLDLSGNGLKIVPSDNIAMLRALARDPYVIKETRADAIYGLVNLMDAARQAAAHLTHPPPILFLYGDKDQIIPRAPTKAVIAALGWRATVKAYPDGYHMLLRDLEGPKVQQDVANWISQQTVLQQKAP